MYLSLHHHPSFSVVAAEGHVLGDAVEGVLDLLTMVPADQPLIIDFERLAGLTREAAVALRNDLALRSSAAPVAVVVGLPEAALHLVLADVDRVAPFVRTRDDAITLVTGVMPARV